MSISTPSKEELRRIADVFGFEFPDEELEQLRAIGDATLASYARLDQMKAPTLPVKYDREAGRAPSEEENPYNAWAWRCHIKGAARGKLVGRSIALKDNICLAGIPLRNGSAVLAGFVPNEDATVVTRILDAGGEILGKAVCEDFCFSGGSHTSVGHPVRNPANPTHSTGGSSSGCGALVAAGVVDMALGGDQGGSIRIPASWCGIVGLKPTYGLVPYTGIFPIEGTLDHTGPMTKNVADAALLLEVIAGEDGLDPRQVAVSTAAYTEALDKGLSGVRVGVVREGFGWEGLSENAVDEAVREATRSMGAQGATVIEISVPLHRDGIHIWNAIALEGATAQMLRGDGLGWNWRGHYSVALRDFYGRARRERANDFPATVKLVALLGQYMNDHYNGHYYATAQNVGRTLRAAYDEALTGVDVLVMPTTPMKAMPIPKNPDLPTYFNAALGMINNTCPFDVTGHPAISVPCGRVDGLPVGMMLIGRWFDEGTLLRVAHGYEQIAG
jgi:amidase